MINESTETKAIIIAMLEPLVKATSAGQNVEVLCYEGDSVKIVYVNGFTARIPIIGDSGIQIIVDVCRALQ